MQPTSLLKIAIEVRVLSHICVRARGAPGVVEHLFEVVARDVPLAVARGPDVGDKVGVELVDIGRFAFGVRVALGCH